MNGQGLALCASFVMGCLLGSAFFGGLWWTLRRLPRARHPTLLVMLSGVIRTAVVIGGIGLVMDARWERAVACLAGFAAMRIVTVWGAAAGSPPGDHRLAVGGEPWS